MPLFLWSSFIFYLSSQPFSDQTMLPFLQKHIPQYRLSQALPNVTVIYGKYNIPAKRYPYQFVQFILRKTAHLIMYFTLATLLYVATIPYKLRRGIRFFMVIALVGGVAALDELYQSTNFLRTGSIQDVGLDLVGGVIGLLISMAIFRRWIGCLNRSDSKDVTS
ncbi:VanZ family protein [Paenibacillus hamazuiensis]|uniref:VanZ family protein n=1 Tax=Paenibacillus hamazuiensis TaxID=2936508 RepID=UPI003B84B444